MISCELWSINCWLKYTGFRLYIQVDGTTGRIFNPVKPTRIGFKFYGWKHL